MERIIINKLGPITYCDLKINDFMVFTGPQASGKSTISKSIFFFKNIKNLLYMQINKRLFAGNDTLELSTKNRLLKEIRSIFLQTFGSTWCMDQHMTIEYYYTDDLYIKICLKKDPIAPNYIWIDFSDKLVDFLNSYDKLSVEMLTRAYNQGEVRKNIDELFEDDLEVIYIPAGRSMMTLFSSQLMYMYSVMNDDQKRSLDYCTQNYLERIKQLLYQGIKEIKGSTGQSIRKDH